MFTLQCLGFNSAHHVLAIKGMHHHGAKVYVLEAHAQPWFSKASFRKKLEEENGDGSEATKEIRNLSNMFNSDCVVWDLPADDLMNPMV